MADNQIQNLPYLWYKAYREPRNKHQTENYNKKVNHLQVTLGSDFHAFFQSPSPRKKNLSEDPSFGAQDQREKIKTFT